MSRFSSIARTAIRFRWWRVKLLLFGLVVLLLLAMLLLLLLLLQTRRTPAAGRPDATHPLLLHRCIACMMVMDLLARGSVCAGARRGGEVEASAAAAVVVLLLRVPTLASAVGCGLCVWGVVCCCNDEMRTTSVELNAGDEDERSWNEKNHEAPQSRRRRRRRRRSLASARSAAFLSADSLVVDNNTLFDRLSSILEYVCFQI